ncbi:MAG: DUF5655 domain-containing protein [Ilumatobacteraceae bacterium]
MPWECPDCGRTFGRQGRGHMCAPGLTVGEYLEDAHPLAGPVHERVHEHLSTLDGELIVDPVGAGILYKHDSTFAMLTSKKKWVALGVMLRRRLDSPRVSLKVSEQSGRFWHTFNLHDPDEIDDEMCEWLTESFHRDRHERPARASWDPMVPDDVDLGPLG